MKKSEVRESLAKLWGHFMREGQFEDAMQIGSALYSEGMRTGDQSLTQEAVQIWRSTLKELSPGIEDAPLHKQCSFCGQTPPEVKLGAGPSVFICNECAAKFNEMFNRRQI